MKQINFLSLSKELRAKIAQELKELQTHASVDPQVEGKEVIAFYERKLDTAKKVVARLNTLLKGEEVTEYSIFNNGTLKVLVSGMSEEKEAVLEQLGFINMNLTSHDPKSFEKLI